LYKEIFIGHSSLDKIGLTKPVQKANVWNIDTAAAFKGPLSAMDVNSKEIWQSSSVFQYYPDEQGRNPQ
jgi:serine/threonine protein phosphatase 1